MPIIEVTLVEGRSPQTKRDLIRALTDAAEKSLRAPRQTIRVLLREMQATHFAIGGVSKAELDRPRQRIRVHIGAAPGSAAGATVGEKSKSKKRKKGGK